MYFAVTTKRRKDRLSDESLATVITNGENSTDALLTAYQQYAGYDTYSEAYEEEGSGNALAEKLLADVFDCTEIHRAMVLEYVERALDGDRTITIIL